MGNSNSKKYAAFISYSHADEKIAKWLQRKLESYKLPTTIHNEFDNSRYLRPIFRDRSDLNGGILTEEIRAHLHNSKYLILICSRTSANSAWVNKEVLAFIEWGRLEYIIPFIVDGELNCNNENECLPLCLREYIATFPDKELLCIDIREGGRNPAYIRVVSRILGVEFDELWHRYERDVRYKRLKISLLLLSLGILYYWFGCAVLLRISLLDTPCNLPSMRNAIVKIGDVDYRIHNSDTIITRVLPGYWRLQKMPISFSATYYCPIDTNVRIGLCRTETLSLRLCRDKTFAIYAGRVVDDKDLPISGVKVIIEGCEMVVSDGDGYFAVELPLCEQDVYKSIRLEKCGYRAIEREDECPSTNIIYKLHKLN